MPLHRNESVSQKALSLKLEETFVMKNYIFLKENVTCFTPPCSDPKVALQPQFLFRTLRGKCPNTEFFLVLTFLYSVRIQEITYKKNSVFGHFSHSGSKGTHIFIIHFIYFILLLFFNVGKKNIPLKVYRRNSFSIKRKC